MQKKINKHKTENTKILNISDEKRKQLQQQR